LGVEHIIVSGDIRKKRNNICRNINAWLKRPTLGMIPLFMAGDKQLFYYANKLRKQTGIDLIIFSMNFLEKTNFKTGFCNVEEGFDQNRHYALDPAGTLKLVSYYARELLLNPAYLNRSIFDSLFAFASYYLIPHNYLHFYKFIEWDEKTINDTLIHEYNWETAEDTTTTWRIGDGTAAFYNYIYYTVAGFTENDTLRSNQIREGKISREEALRAVAQENRPRYQSLREYAGIVGFDCDEAIRIINSMPRLYKI
ncbi:MAG: hypothetical protein U9N45_06640, partial [Gemmatimonadota bacterium]|nr:hypothetical protein [Gemmatimonadota bacterium]